MIRSFILVSLFSSLAFSADLEAGKVLYQNRCATCHGANGINAVPNFPNLAGQKESYVNQQLLDFKSGKRYGTMMPSMIQDLTAEQYANLSAFIASLSPCQTDIE